MSQNLHDATLTLDIRVPHRSRLLTWAARAAADLRAWLALARTRRVVGALDARQLADAGIDASAYLPPRPIITVEPGLMNRLMTMP